MGSREKGTEPKIALCSGRSLSYIALMQLVGTAGVTSSALMVALPRIKADAGH